MNIHSKLQWTTIINRLNKDAGYKKYELEHKCAGAGLYMCDKDGDIVKFVIVAIQETYDMTTEMKRRFIEMLENGEI